jgi:putative DNA methylase
MERTILEKGLPVGIINIEATMEKYASPPTVRLHRYTTRKPLITSRMVVAATVLTENDIKQDEDFIQLLGIDKKLKNRAYKNLTNKLYNKINEKYAEKPTILDPFAGSGTIPFEALRLGLDVVAVDYNPVAFLIMKGTLEYPIKYSSIIFKDIEKYSSDILSKLKNSLSRHYPKHNGVSTLAYMYSWAVKCPTCGNITPLVHSWILDGKKNICLRYEIKENKIHYNIVKDKNHQEGNIRRGKGTCLICSSQISNKDIVGDISQNQREILMAVFLEDRTFILPTVGDQKAIEIANKELIDNMHVLGKYIPNEKIMDDIRAKKYLQYWYKLFNPRQLLLFSTFIKEIDEIVSKISLKDKEYAAAVGTYLSMIFARHLDSNSRCTYWQNSTTRIKPVMALVGVNMMWDHPEVNPFEKTSGSLLINIKHVLGGLKFAIDALNDTSFGSRNTSSVQIKNSSILSWKSKKQYKYIITDPPYYDDVPYPEIFQYFQVWHNKILGDLLNIPSIPSTSEELSVGRNRSKEMFEARMSVAFKKLHNLLENDGILVMFYAHKSIEGWKFVLEALRKSEFKVTSTITLMTESKGSILAKGKASVFHSLVLTARKRLDNKTANLLDIEEEIRNKIEEKYPELVEIYGNDRVNLMVAASGIVIETITSYSEITSFTRNTADYAIEMGQKYLIETFARNTLNIDHVDVKTMLYTWFRHSPKDEIPYSDFNQTLKAFGAVEETIEDIIKTNQGNILLVDYIDRDALEVDGMDPLMATSVIDAVHIALRAYSRGGINQAKPGIDSSPFGTLPIINTLEALAIVSATKTGYQEGKICLQFIKDWNVLHGRPQSTQLRDHLKSIKKEQIKL